jgi:hypothetical protein
VLLLQVGEKLTITTKVTISSGGAKSGGVFFSSGWLLLG